jgi:hypothetical protein
MNGVTTLVARWKPHGLPGPGRSPVATSEASPAGAAAHWLKESERMPTVTPEPSMPKSLRARAASSWRSPSVTTAPCGQEAPVPWVNGVISSLTASTPGTAASRRSRPGRAATVTVS